MRIPLFPEFPRYREDQLELTGSEVYVPSSALPFHSNPGTALEKIIKRAGLKRWSKLWNNLRSTRDMELPEEFPGHVVAAWMGNTEDVSRRHDKQVTDQHFERAVKSAAQANARSPETDREPQPARWRDPRFSGSFAYFDRLRSIAQ